MLATSGRVPEQLVVFGSMVKRTSAAILASAASCARVSFVRPACTGPETLTLPSAAIATVNGREVPVLRANHALRAVEVPAGRRVLHYEYRPGSFRNGVVLSAVALIVMIVWLVVAWRIGRRGTQ